MKKVLIVLGLLAIIFILAIASRQQWQKIPKSLSQNSSLLSPLQFDELKKELDAINPQGETNGGSYSEFSDPENKFKIQYPSDWLAIKDETILGGLISEGAKEKFNLRALFLAQGLQKDNFGQIIFARGIFNMTPEKIIEVMQKDNQEQGWQMEIIKSDAQENEGTFEIKYQTPTGQLLHSKERVWTKGQDAYLLSFVVFEKDWEEFGEKADFAISASQVLTK